MSHKTIVFEALYQFFFFLLADDLNWLQRVEVILELARLLDFIHSQEKQSLPIKFRASNILLDWVRIVAL